MLGYNPLSSFHLPVDQRSGHTEPDNTQIPQLVYKKAGRPWSIPSAEPVNISYWLHDAAWLIPDTHTVFYKI